MSDTAPSAAAPTPNPKEPSREVRDELRAKWGEVFRLAVEDFEDMDGNPTPPDVILVRRPNEVEVRRYFDKARAERGKPTLDSPRDVLVRAVRVWPDDVTFAAMLDRRRGLLAPFGDAVERIAGVVEEASTKKA